jgi:hypothetical protein
MHRSHLLVLLIPILPEHDFEGSLVTTSDIVENAKNNGFQEKVMVVGCDHSFLYDGLILHLS